MAGPEEQPRLDEFYAEDFDAYLPNKWNSNMFTLERRKVKNKLEHLGHDLNAVLEETGLSLLMHSSDEFPSFWNKKKVDSQWLFFSRDEAAREELAHIIETERTLKDSLTDPTPLYRHLFLGVSITQSHLEIGLRLHYDAWVDRKNLLSLCSDADRRRALGDLIRSLPDHFSLGTESTSDRALVDFEPGQLEALIDTFVSEKAWLFLGARLPRDQVLVLEGDIVDTAIDVFEALIPIYRFIAWSPANDAISIDQVVEERNAALRRSREELDRERAEREAMLREKEAQGLALKEEIADKIRETNAWRSREVAARRAAAIKAQQTAKEDDARARAEAMAASWGLGDKTADAADATSTPETPQKAADRPARSPRSSERAPEKRRPPAPATGAPAPPPGEIAVGAYVEVTRGFLKGKWGKIQEIDEKGGLKVGFGALSSRLEVSDVTLIDPAERASKDRARKRRPRPGRHQQNRA